MSANIGLVIVDVNIWYNKDKIQQVIFIEISGCNRQLINLSNQTFTNIKHCDLYWFQSYFKFDLRHDLSCLFILNIKVKFIYFFGCTMWLVGFYFPDQGLLGPSAVRAWSPNPWASRQFPKVV